MPKQQLEEDYSYDETQPKPFPIRKIVAFFAILLVLIIVISLILSVLGQNNSIFGMNGEKIGSKVTISKNGELIDSYETDGNNLELKGNPQERTNSKLDTGVNGKNTSTKIIVKNSSGKIIAVIKDPENVYVDENGQINFSINPLEDLDLSEYFDENTQEYIFPEGGSVDLILDFVINDNDTNQSTIIEIPATYTFVQFLDNGCISLSRTSVKEVTHYGALEINAKLKVNCQTNANLVSLVEWNSQKMGNVEVTFQNNKYGGVIAETEKTILPLPIEGEYDAKIVFTPSKEYAGQKADFAIKFALDSSEGKIDFDVPIDNLEQCVKVTPASMNILENQDSTKMTIDVSSCHSKSVEFSLCDNDSSCSGGTEGGIEFDQLSFSLVPKGNSTKTINISRKEISGAYGIPIYAKVSGAEKVFIDEKVLIVEPTKLENIVPDKFVISLIGGTKDSIRVKNNTLAEDIDVQTNICTLYKSSQGLENYSSAGTAITSYAGLGETWWEKIYSDYDYYSGTGKYQASIINTLSAVDNISATAQSYSQTRNALLKDAYSSSTGIYDKTLEVISDAKEANQATLDLRDAIGNVNDLADVDIASQIASLVTGIVGLATDIAALTAELDALDTEISTLEKSQSKCQAVSTQVPNMVSGMTLAKSTGPLYAKDAVQAVTTTNSIYSMYKSLESLSQGQELIEADSAIDNTDSALTMLNQLELKAKNSADYMDLMLDSASINSLSAASTSDAKAKNYLLLAKGELTTMQPILTNALDPLLTAGSDITTSIGDSDVSKTDLTIAITSALVSLSEMIVEQIDRAGSIQKGVSMTSKALIAATKGAATACADDDSACCDAVPALQPAKAQLEAVQTRIGSQYASLTKIIGVINTLYSAFRMYQQATTDYGPQLVTASSKITAAVESIYDLQDELETALDSIDPAITAAGELTTQEKNSSDASTYLTTDSLVTLEGNFNKNRLIGLIGTAVSTGFVNGAYEGGVYTTRDTSVSSSTSTASAEAKSYNNENNGKIYFMDSSESDASADLKEDCANDVMLKLPDYIINLVHDGETINVSNAGVGAIWDFSDAKVFDVFEEQEVGVTFYSNGITKNGYGVVEFNVIKHVNANPAVANIEFGPFNLPDTSKQPKVMKYHFKFNAAPRTGSNYVSFTGNNCTNGLLRGSSGESALPKTILSWDWNSVSGLGSISSSSKSYRTLESATVGEGTQDEPYLDATQLSILISKKIGALTNFLDTVTPTCPQNPAEKVLEKVRVNVLDSETGLTYTGSTSSSTCYLPLTTKDYDGIPAIYYYFEDATTTDWDNWFSDSEKVSNAKEMNKIIDFNVNLIRDGYGFDFQYDFVNEYTGSILKAGPSFTDPLMGAKKYLEEKDNAYFSSQANMLKANAKWALPDAGKYRVRLLTELEDDAKLFTSGYPKAKIVVDLYLLEPVNNNYSPWLYTPIDGGVGARYSSNRQKYGSSIMNSNIEFDISNTSGVSLDSTQKDSLSRIPFNQNTNFSILNALPSMRGKILDYTYNYNTKTYNDNNSKIVFSPTTATPLLFELYGVNGQQTNFLYSITRDNSTISSTLSNMFLLSGVGTCNDFAQTPLTEYFKNSPDFGSGQTFGVWLPTAEKSGKTYIKTVAYSPISENYSLIKPLNGQVYTTNDLQGITNPLSLGGISTMTSNDKSNSSTPDSLYDAFKGVEAGSICASSLGSREILWWAEDTMYNKVGKEGTAISSKINDSSVSCVR